MRKNVFFIFILALMWSCSTPETPKTTVLYSYTPYSYAPEFLNGQVKSVKELTYWAVDNNGSIEKGALVTTKEKGELNYTLDFIAHYDVDGNIVQCKYFLDDNKFNVWDVESVDGKMVKATFTRDDTIQYYQRSEYDGANESITGFSMPEDTIVRTYKVFDNEAGIARRMEFFNAKNEQLGYNLYESNENNRITEFKSFNVQDSLLSTFIMTYNNMGFNSTLKSFDGNGEVNWDGEFEYLTFDEHNNWTRMKASNDGELKFIIEREYQYY